MKAALVLVAVLALTGCWESRKDTTENVVHHDQFTVDGAVTMPGAGGALPIHLAITHDGTDVTSSHEEKKSEIDSAAIGREIAGALGPLLQGATAATPWGMAGGVGSAVAGLGIAYLGYKKRQQMKGGAK